MSYSKVNNNQLLHSGSQFIKYFHIYYCIFFSFTYSFNKDLVSTSSYFPESWARSRKSYEYIAAKELSLIVQ